MEIVREMQGTTCVIHLKGDLDVAASTDVEQALAEGLVEAAVVVVDLSGVPFADSSGLGGLIAAYKRAKSVGREIRLRRPTPIVAEILTITRMKRFFPMEE